MGRVAAILGTGGLCLEPSSHWDLEASHVPGAPPCWHCSPGLSTLSPDSLWRLRDPRDFHFTKFTLVNVTVVSYTSPLIFQHICTSEGFWFRVLP